MLIPNKMYYIGRFQLTPQFRLQKSYQINFDKSCIQTAFLVAALLSHTLASRGVAKETMRFENDDGATMKVNMVNDVAGHMEKLLVPVVPSKRVSKTHQNPMNKNSMYILYIYIYPRNPIPSFFWVQKKKVFLKIPGF